MNKEFEWTADLLAEFIRDYGDREGMAADLMEQFKESKQPKPEWEITEYRGKRTLKIYQRVPSGGWCSTDGASSFCDRSISRSDSGCEIYSIKRLCDNSVWRLDDKFIANAGIPLTIRRFDITERGMQVWSKEFGFWFLEEIKKPLIFTTEDGVDIFNIHLQVCSVGKSSFEVSECRADIIQKGHHDHYLYFSCREKAEEYVLMNKPLLSVNNVIDILQGMYYLPELIEKARNNKP